MTSGCLPSASVTGSCASTPWSRQQTSCWPVATRVRRCRRPSGRCSWSPSARRLILRMIRIHLSEGNYCEAMRQYNRCVAIMNEAFGVPPSPGFTELVRMIMPGEDRDGVGVSARAVTLTQTPACRESREPSTWACARTVRCHAPCVRRLIGSGTWGTLRPIRENRVDLGLSMDTEARRQRRKETARERRLRTEQYRRARDDRWRRNEERATESTDGAAADDQPPDQSSRALTGWAKG